MNMKIEIYGLEPRQSKMFDKLMEAIAEFYDDMDERVELFTPTYDTFKKTHELTVEGVE